MELADAKKDINENLKNRLLIEEPAETTDRDRYLTVSPSPPPTDEGPNTEVTNLSPVSIEMERPELTLLQFAEGVVEKPAAENLQLTELTPISSEIPKLTPESTNQNPAENLVFTELTPISKERPKLTPISTNQTCSKESAPLSPLSFAFEKNAKANRTPKKMCELEVVDCESDNEIDDDVQEAPQPLEKSASTSGWERFGRKVEEEERKKKKVYVVRSIEPRNDYIAVTKRSSKAKKIDGNKTDDSKDGDEGDIDVDVVGMAEDDENDIRLPPSLPPQRPQNSRFEKQRLKKDLAIMRRSQNNYDSDDDTYYRKRPRIGASPPPCLERQTGDEPSSSNSETDGILKRFGKVSSSQLLKTKFSSSQFPTLPLTKRIMEQNKAAHEKSAPNSVIKKVIATRKNQSSVAPKILQIPAYSDRSTITCYTNGDKSKFPRLPQNNMSARDYPANACYRCSDNSYYNVDMSTFKFMEDSTAISVRAHLCDQTRVMIARTALWNREYARKLGDRAIGTSWQKPDEVTAQQTGFCSATVRRCIEIANMSMVPKCAERTGVSNNELSSLRTAFSEDAKFCGQKMRNPHVLNQYYHLKQNAAAERANDIIAKASLETAKQIGTSSSSEKKSTTSETLPPPLAKRTATDKPGPSSNQPLRRPVLRWPGSPSKIPPKNSTGATVSSTDKLVLHTRPPPPPLPSMARKTLAPNTAAKTTGRNVSTESKVATSSSRRGRGRPKKVREVEEDGGKIDVDDPNYEPEKKPVKKVEEKLEKKIATRKVLKRITNSDVSAILQSLVDRVVNAHQTPPIPCIAH